MRIKDLKEATPIEKQIATLLPATAPRPLDTEAIYLEPWVIAVEAAGGLPDDYNTWLRTALALAALGEPGREMFHRVSCLSPKYKPAEADDKFNEVLKSGRGEIGPGTFVHLCKEAGIKLSGQLVCRKQPNRSKDANPTLLPTSRRPTRGNIIDQLGMNWTIYYDDSSSQYYRSHLEENDPAKWQKFDERSPIVNEWLIELESAGLNTDKRTLLEAIQSAYCYQKINYLTARFDYLAAGWDGKNYLTQLTATVATDDDALFAILLKKWLLNTVAQAYCNSAGCRNEHALVLVSAQQGVGKTSFFAGLMWDDTLFASVPEFRFDNKEHRLLMTSKLLILLDEMGQYKKADIETLKAGISQYQITADKKFQPSGDYPRVGSFAGCSNNESFLKDDTGDRRFWVFTLNKFFRSAYEAIPKEQLWGQLVQLYKAGEIYLPTSEEEAAVTARNNDKFAADKPEDAFISECLIITKESTDYIRAPDMQEALDQFRYAKKGQSFLSIEVVRKKLQRLGIESSVKRRVGSWQGRGYVGVKLKYYPV
jgi:predicted P-loop ATPase